MKRCMHTPKRSPLNSILKSMAWPMAITFSLLFLFTAFGSLHLSIRRKSSHARSKYEEKRRQHIPTHFNNTRCSLVAMDQGIFTSATTGMNRSRLNASNRHSPCLPSFQWTNPYPSVTAVVFQMDRTDAVVCHWCMLYATLWLRRVAP